MTEFKIWGSDFWETLKQKEFPLAVQSRMLDEAERVKANVEADLAKPQSGDKLVLSKLEKVFPSQEEITYTGLARKARHARELNMRKR